MSSIDLVVLVKAVAIIAALLWLSGGLRVWKKPKSDARGAPRSDA